MEGGASPGASIKIVLADDHPVVRSGLRLLLESEDDFEVVAAAGDAGDAMRFTSAHPPDVLILDLNMPGEMLPQASPLEDERPADLDEATQTVLVQCTIIAHPCAWRVFAGG